MILKSVLDGEAPIKSEKQKKPAKILIIGAYRTLNVIAKDQKISHVEIYKGARQIREACRKLRLGPIVTEPWGLGIPVSSLRYLTFMPLGTIPATKLIAKWHNSWTNTPTYANPIIIRLKGPLSPENNRVDRIFDENKIMKNHAISSNMLSNNLEKI